MNDNSMTKSDGLRARMIASEVNRPGLTVAVSGYYYYYYYYVIGPPYWP